MRLLSPTCANQLLSFIIAAVAARPVLLLLSGLLPDDNTSSVLQAVQSYCLVLNFGALGNSVQQAVVAMQCAMRQCSKPGTAAAYGPQRTALVNCATALRRRAASVRMRARPSSVDAPSYLSEQRADRTEAPCSAFTIS